MNETIGDRIAKYRKAMGMTQEDLANQMGVSSQAVSKWENDVSCPDISLLPQLCKILGVSTDELLMGRKDGVRMLPPNQRKSLDELTLRVRIDDSDGDRIRVNLPMSLVKVCLDVGIEVVPNMSGMENMGAIQNIDLNKIMELAERGMIGKIVEIDDADGDHIEVVVE